MPKPKNKATATEATATAAVPTFNDAIQNLGRVIGSAASHREYVAVRLLDEGFTLDKLAAKDADAIKTRDAFRTNWIAGYLTTKSREFVDNVNLTKETHKALAGSTKEKGSPFEVVQRDKRLAQCNECMAWSAVCKIAFPEAAEEPLAEDASEEEKEKAKAELLEKATSDYLKARTAAEAKFKKMRQNIQDLGGNIYAEAKVTAAFLDLAVGMMPKASDVA